MIRKRIAIFASGNGSNAEAIISYLANTQDIEVVAIYSNNANAYVLERAKRHGISAMVFNKAKFKNEQYQNQLIEENFDLIVLAGFMWLIPEKLVNAYPKKIINIHPALLPKYGGKGMYGHFVHEAVLHNKESRSGITIHYVNDKYDDGDIILQASCEVNPDDTADSLAARIHLLEHEHYPQVIAKLCSELTD